jgi:hypothetical protein
VLAGWNLRATISCVSLPSEKSCAVQVHVRSEVCSGFNASESIMTWLQQTMRTCSLLMTSLVRPVDSCSRIFVSPRPSPSISSYRQRNGRGKLVHWTETEHCNLTQPTFPPPRRKLADVTGVLVVTSAVAVATTPNFKSDLTGVATAWKWHTFLLFFIYFITNKLSIFLSESSVKNVPGIKHRTSFIIKCYFDWVNPMLFWSEK